MPTNGDDETTVRLETGRVSRSVLPPRFREPVLIARGGMSEVYRATDAELGRVVAVKLLDDRQAADGELPRRFDREARAAARLSGEPHTVTIHDVGVWQGRPFIVMEYLGGGSLQDILRRDGAQPAGSALRWLEEAAGALDHAHAEGVVHRDVKPANLLLDDQGRLHVADFGIATALGLTSLTRTGTVLGTAGYLAPEQAEGKPAGAAADRYSLGVVAFELLTGVRPFRRDSTTAEAAAHVNAPIPSASSLGDDLPALVDPVFRRALAKDPSARFATCRELVNALRAAYDANAATTGVVVGATRPARRRRMLLALAALLVSAGVLLGAELAGGHGRAPAQLPPRTVTISTTVPARATEAASLAGQGEILLAAGRSESAVPLLEQAARLLSGSGTTAEANADWSLASAYADLGRCGDALPLLDRAQTIQGAQPRFDDLRALCTGPPGHQPGHGRGNHSRGKGQDSND